MARKYDPAKAAEKRQRMKSLAAKLAAMTDAERAALGQGLVTIEGHPLSIRNACLVLFQNPTATVVGGYDQWRKAGRQVRQGEHGALAWFPMGTKDDDDRARFGTTHFFDVTQTDPLVPGAVLAQDVLENPDD